MRPWHLAAVCGAAFLLPGTVRAADVDWNAARSFWSFRPVHKPALPTVKNAAWPKTEIDRFILARLEAAGLRPVGFADKRTLIRRATFDLIGLPPTPEEIDDFLVDASPKAFERVVDRLLASPHYGERWARHWLDVARYAEDQAHTFGVKPNTEAYRYRDWVIEAFNTGMPFDRFVKLQIAADQMDVNEPNGYRHRAALGYFGLGAQYYKNSDAARAAADELDDRIDTLARGFLGLTVSCARCHDHKFDPIPTQDYYSIAGIFQSTKLANAPLAPKEEVDRYETGQKKMQDADRLVKEFISTEKTKIAEKRADEIVPYLLATWQLRARQQDDPKFTATQQAQRNGLNATTLNRWMKLFADNKTSQNVTALEAWRKVPPPNTKDAEVPADVRKAAEDFEKQVRSALAKGAGFMPASVKGGKANADKARLDMLQAVFGDSGVLAITDADMMAKLDAERKSHLESMQATVDQIKKTLPPTPVMAHGITDGTPTDMKVFLRGNPATLGDVAPRRFLHVLISDEPQAFTKGSGRLELANAIASADNPLTARVFVNRVWAWHFGRGIVGTPSNFGKLGEPPTHPELLDYLAARFVESGWDVKALHRAIMLSSVYQLSSNSELNAVDPENRLLWRANRLRLEVECWRDSLLAVSGQLDRGFGGPTTDLNSTQNHRRTVYARVSRHELNGLLRLFDFPDANITAERRTETTVPQQQLFVLNSPFFLGQAKALAARVQKEASDDASRVKRAYELTYGRPASEDEVALALRFLGGKDDPTETGRNQLTRWERYSQVLLAGNEFLYVD